MPASYLCLTSAETIDTTVPSVTTGGRPVATGSGSGDSQRSASFMSQRSLSISSNPISSEYTVHCTQHTINSVASDCNPGVGFSIQGSGISQV